MLEDQNSQSVREMSNVFVLQDSINLEYTTISYYENVSYDSIKGRYYSTLVDNTYYQSYHNDTNDYQATNYRIIHMKWYFEKSLVMANRFITLIKHPTIKILNINAEICPFI